MSDMKRTLLIVVLLAVFDCNSETIGSTGALKLDGRDNTEGPDQIAPVRSEQMRLTR